MTYIRGYKALEPQVNFRVIKINRNASSQRECLGQ